MPRQDIIIANTRALSTTLKNVLPITIPPLRERSEDLPALVAHHGHLLRGKIPGQGFLDALGRHPWPGNVRELLQVLKRAAIQLPGPEIGAEVEGVLFGAVGQAAEEPSHDPHLARVEAALDGGVGFWDSAWQAFLDRDLNRTQLRDMLRRRFAEHGNSLRRLAEALNIPAADYPRFVSALHKYDVHPGKG